MPIPIKTCLLFVIATAALVACSTTKDDPTPTEAPSEPAQVELELSEVLPAQTWLVAGYDLAGYRDLQHHSTVPREIVSLLTPRAPIFELLLGEVAPEGLDGDGSLTVALSREGLDEAMLNLRHASPSLLGQEAAKLPEILHVRVVVPATDTARLEQSIEDHCQDNCPELFAMESIDSKVLLDLSWRVDSGFGPIRDAEFSAEAGFDADDTAAWHAFRDGDAPIRLYSRTGDVFDQMALFQWVESLQVATGEDHDFGAAELLAIAQEVAFDDPTTAESHDVMLSLHRQGSVVYLDALATLTDYGQSLVDALATGAPMKDRSRQDAAFEMQWGFDLSGAIGLAARPHWVGRIPSIDGADADFDLLSKGMARDSRWGLPVTVFRSPVTSYALFDEFFGRDTTPSEFAMVRGFWMQIFEVADEEIITAMGLHLPTDAPLDQFEDFAKAALLPFGSAPQLRTVEIGDGLEYQASTAVAVDQLFGDEEVSVDSEIRARADLRRLAQMVGQMDDAFGMAGTEGMLLNFVANMGAPQLHFYTGFSDGQALSRIQWGGDELVRPTPVAAADQPAPTPSLPQCLIHARQWSLLGLAQLATLDDNDARAKLGAEMSRHLSELAAECEGEPSVQRLAADWAAIGVE